MIGKRPRVLLVGEAVTLSHVVRPAELGRGLHAAGFDVTLACDPRFARLLGPLPYRVVPLKTVFTPELVAERRRTMMPLFDHATLDRAIREDARLMAVFEPDLVVADMRQSLSISARRRGTPLVVVSDSVFSPYCAVPFSVPATPLHGLVDAHTERSLFELVLPFGHFLHALPANLQRHQHGIEGWVDDLRKVYVDGDYVAYPEIPGIVPMHDLPPTHRFVGPVLWSPAVPLPDWWSSLPEDRPLVWLNVSPSSPDGVLPTLVAALSGIGATVVVGASRERVGVTPGPDTFLADHLPGIEVARRAALVVCNGGAMSVQQSLACGTPVLSVAAFAEQLMYGSAVAATGAGEVLAIGDVTAENAVALVSKMLADPRYKAAAGRIAARMKRLPSAPGFTAFVEEILASRTAPPQAAAAAAAVTG